jgi:fatty acid desaturase
MLMFILVTATFVAVYWFWIRPVLKSRPAFRELYEQEESLFTAVREKFAGIKQKLSSAIVVAASVAVSGYDFIAPIASGVDVSSIAAQVPSWAWPLVLITVTALFQFLRNLSDKRHKAELAEDPAPAEGR